MKVLCVYGSPRKKGNSTTVARKFLEAAEIRGASVETYRLNDLNFKACQACYACKTKLEHCALKDDLSPVLDAMTRCDLLVVATPVYYGDVSAQTKAFIDRTFSFVKPNFHERPDPSRLDPGKKCLWIMTQESNKDLYSDIFPRYEFFFKAYGFDTHLIRTADVEEPGEVRNVTEVMAQAEEMAEKLIA